MKGFIFRAYHCYGPQIIRASDRSAITFETEESHIAAISSRKSNSLGNEIRREVRVCNYCGTTLTQSHPLKCHPQEGTKGLADSHKHSYLVDTRFAGK